MVVYRPLIDTVDAEFCALRQEPVGDSCLLIVFPVCAILISAARVILFNFSRHLDDSKLYFYTRANTFFCTSCSESLKSVVMCAFDVITRKLMTKHELARLIRLHTASFKMREASDSSVSSVIA